MLRFGKTGAAALAAGLCVLLAACAVQGPVRNGKPYQASDDPAGDVEATLARAQAEDKRALVVLGANWCHDSLALAARIQQPPLSNVVTRYYETVLVDVGYLDQGRKLARDLGIPTYYATPTVLIIDPESGAIINDRDRHQWGAAESISMEDSVAYFERMARAEAANVHVGELAELFAAIDEYERRMAAKVERGFDRVGPMLRTYKAGGEAPESFEHDWNEVAEYRKGVPAVVASLRAEARQRVAAGESGISLPFPPISKYSWE